MAPLSSRPTEAAFVIGKERPMVGITTAPSRRPPGAARDWVVLLNAGIVHRVGPNRLYVQLARALGSRGHAVLRFDLAGIGDSEPPAQVTSSWECALLDIRQALDWLSERRGAESFVLAGLCSGADQAISYAGSDPRVRGCVLLDPSIPSTPRQRRRELARKLLRRRSLGDMLDMARRAGVAAHDSLMQSRPQPAPTPSLAIGIDDPRARAYLENAYRAAVEQAVSLYVHCTNDRPFLVNYREQLLDAFPSVPFDDRLQLVFDLASDHTFEDEACRTRLIDDIVEWCGRPRAASGMPTRGPSPPLTEATNP